MTDNSLTFEEYREHVETMADNVVNAVEEYDMKPSEAVFEEVDSSELVIYTHYYAKVLQHTEPQEWSHLVADDETDYRKVLQAMAFDAIRSDVYEELHDRNIEL